MILEQQLLNYAKAEIARAEDNRTSAAISCDYAYSNGTYDAYTHEITKWTNAARFIVEKYKIEDSNIKPNIYKLDRAIILKYFGEELALAYDSRREPYSRYFKQKANFFAYLLKIDHPFPGVDMIDPNIINAA